MHCIVAYALIVVADDAGALRVGGLPGLASQMAILKGADTWITAFIFDEPPAAAYGLAVPVVPAGEPVIDPLVVAICVRLAGLAVCVRRQVRQNAWCKKQLESAFVSLQSAAGVFGNSYLPQFEKQPAMESPIGSWGTPSASEMTKA